MKKRIVHSNYITPRRGRDNVYKQTAPTTDIVKMLGFDNLSQNLKDSLVSWHSAGYPVIDGVEWNRRVSICRSCEYWEESGKTKTARCTKCGCSSGKLLLSTSKCPLSPPKW